MTALDKSLTGSSAFLPNGFGQLLITTATQESIALQVSTVTTTVHDTFRIPLVTGDPTAGWYAENEEIGLGTTNTDEEVVTPRKIARIVKLSRELVEDSTPASAEVVGQSLARSLAAGIDAAFFGTADGTAATPRGLGAFLDTELATVDAGAAWTTADPFIEAAFAIETAGATVKAWTVNPADAEALAKIKKATGSVEPLLQPDVTQAGRRSIAGVPMLITPAVPAGTVYGIPAGRVFAVVRSDVDVERDDSVYFTSYSTALRAVARVGFGYPQPNAIARIKLSA